LGQVGECKSGAPREIAETDGRRATAQKDFCTLRKETTTLYETRNEEKKQKAAEGGKK